MISNREGEEVEQVGTGLEAGFWLPALYIFKSALKKDRKKQTNRGDV